MLLESNSKVFFTADWHHGSGNIIKYCNRPFSSVEEMNDTLISNYNSVVTKKDKCYFLGDTVWGHKNYRHVFEQLNGEKFIVLGNHDNEQCYKKLLIDHVIHGVYKVKGITIDNQYVWMSHYCHQVWNNSFHGSFHFFGHSHNTLKFSRGKSCDVGVDRWDYFPVDFETLYLYLKDRDNKNFYSTNDSNVMEGLS